MACLMLLFASCKKEAAPVIPPPPTLPDNDNMLMGNPSGALHDSTDFDDYLMVKTFYSLSYSRSQGKPNWVSWHVQNTDLGSVGRQDDFRQDDSLPVSWYHVNESSYSGSGFDRGAQLSFGRQNCYHPTKLSHIPDDEYDTAGTLSQPGNLGRYGRLCKNPG